MAEFIGVFTLVFIGAGSIVTTSYMGWGAMGPSTLLVVALAHGLALATMITALGHLSGGHFNPAVTIAAAFTKRIEADLGALYIIFQLLGGIFGAFLLMISLPEQAWSAVNLGTPTIDLTRISAAKAVFLEAVMTFFLVFVVFGAGIDPKNRNGFKAAGGLAIGFVVAMDILMGGPLTGAAMNPARAFGPALVTRSFDNHLIYWFGPIIGGILAGLLYDTLYFSRRAPKEENPMGEGTKMRALQPEPDTMPGGHDPTSLDEPRSG